MMRKFRVYRKIFRVEYKDVEAQDMTEAIKHRIDPREGFKITDDGYILDSLATVDLSEERGNDIFIEFKEQKRGVK